MTKAVSQPALLGGVPVRRRPFPVWPQADEKDVQAVAEAVRRGAWWRFSSDAVSNFERAFAEYQDAKHALACSNGTTALVLALRALGVGPGDEVIVPAYTFIATASAVLQANAVPIFADIAPDTLNLSVASARAALTSRTKAIIPVHFAGLPAGMEALKALAAERGVKVLEDAAHAHGAVHAGRKLGALGDLGCFSFQQSKNLTSGEGGAVLTDNDELAALVASLSNFGRLSRSPFYEHHALGTNFRMTALQGALLISQIKKLEEQTARRYENGKALTKKLRDLPGLAPVDPAEPPQSRRAYHLYIIRYDAETWDGLPRERLIEALKAEGIPASEGYPIPLYRNPLFLERRFGPGGFPLSSDVYRGEVDYGSINLPECERICRESIWLVQSMLLDEPGGMDDIAAAFAKLYENRQVLRDHTERGALG